MHPLSVVPQHQGALTEMLAEELTVREWAKLLVLTGISKNETAASKLLRMRTTASRETLVQGGLTKVVAFSGMPEDWKQKLETLRVDRMARTFTGLLTAAEPRWEPSISVSDMTQFNTDKALMVKDVMSVYFGLLDLGQTEKHAVLKAQHRWEEKNPPAHGEKQAHVGASTIRRWAARVKKAGGFAKAPLQAYGEARQTPHHTAQLSTKLRKDVPAGVKPEDYDFEAFMAHFSGLCVREGMVNIASAYTAVRGAWQSMARVPGLGAAERPGMLFPLTYDQLKRLAPGYATRLLGGRGKFRAIVDGALPTVRRSTLSLQLCQRFELDDTRMDFVVKDRITGREVGLKLYIVLEIATRRVVAWVVRRGGEFTAADTAVLIAKTLRDVGFAGENAGYASEFIVENGCVAMPDDRKAVLEAMYPGQLVIKRTDIERGALIAGGWNQRTAKFWQKPHIESFNRTWGFLSRRIPGQRGSDFRHMPATLGTSGVNRKAGTGELSIVPGSMMDESRITSRAARFMAALGGASGDELDAAAAQDSTGIKAPLLYEDEAMDAIAAIVAEYNRNNEHKMEGFEEVWVHRADGRGVRLKESPNQKWQRLFGHQYQQGTAPVRAALQDLPMLFMRAERVTVTPQGVKWNKSWYTHAHSAAVIKAQSLSTLSFECLALCEEDCPEHIFLLKNSIHGHRPRAVLGEKPQLWEVLPLDVPANDAASEAAYAHQVQQNHNAVLGGLARASEALTHEHTTRRANSLNKIAAAFSSTFGIDLETSRSKMGELVERMRGHGKAPAAPGEKPLQVVPVTGDLATEEDDAEAPLPGEAGDRRDKADDAMSKLLELMKQAGLSPAE